MIINKKPTLVPDDAPEGVTLKQIFTQSILNDKNINVWQKLTQLENLDEKYGGPKSASLANLKLPDMSRMPNYRRITPNLGDLPTAQQKKADPVMSNPFTSVRMNFGKDSVLVPVMGNNDSTPIGKSHGDNNNQVILPRDQNGNYIKPKYSLDQFREITNKFYQLHPEKSPKSGNISYIPSMEEADYIYKTFLTDEAKIAQQEKQKDWEYQKGINDIKFSSLSEEKKSNEIQKLQFDMFNDPQTLNPRINYEDYGKNQTNRPSFNTKDTPMKKKAEIDARSYLDSLLAQPDYASMRTYKTELDREEQEIVNKGEADKISADTKTYLLAIAPNLIKAASDNIYMLPNWPLYASTVLADTVKATATSPSQIEIVPSQPEQEYYDKLDKVQKKRDYLYASPYKYIALEDYSTYNIDGQYIKELEGYINDIIGGKIYIGIEGATDKDNEEYCKQYVFYLKDILNMNKNVIKYYQYLQDEYNRIDGTNSK